MIIPARHTMTTMYSQAYCRYVPNLNDEVEQSGAKSIEE